MLTSEAVSPLGAPPRSLDSLGRYTLLGTLGEGGMGTIHLAVSLGVGDFRKLLVLKELRRDLVQNERFVRMFLSEAKLAARLNHPNVVQTLEAGRAGERLYLAMEFLDGQPLYRIVKYAQSEPQFPLAFHIHVLCEALTGVHYAHELCDYDGTHLRIVHRDISPQNIFVTYDGNVKVVDFGIAKGAETGDQTHPGVFKGKFSYAAPEQLTGSPVDRRADVFAFGVMLWEAVSGSRFAARVVTQESFEARIRGTYPRLSDTVLGVDSDLAAICDRAIHLDPNERFETAEDMRRALEQYLHDRGIRLDAPMLARLLRSKFHTERTSMHETISERIRAHDFSESVMLSLKPFGAHEPLDSDPTTVADLSALAKASGPRNLASAPSNTENMAVAARSGPRKIRVYMAAGAAGLAALLFWQVMRSRDEATEPPTEAEVVQTDFSLSSSSQVAKPSKLPRSETLANPDTTSDDVLTELAEPPQAERRKPPPSLPKRSFLAQPKASIHSAISRRTTQSPPIVSETGSAPASAERPPGRGTPNVVVRDELPATAPIEMGADIRPFARRQRRALDLEDPFK